VTDVANVLLFKFAQAGHRIRDL